MKKFLYLGAVAVLALAASCTGGKPDFKTEKHSSELTADYARLSIQAELPLATTDGASVMRQTLVDVMDKALSHIDNYEQKRFFPRFDGDVNDSGALFSYYEHQALEEITFLSQGMFDERAEGIRESETLSDEEKEKFVADFPGWEFDFNLEKTWETDLIAVFDSQNYLYMAGAHGGVIGEGPMTFDKQSGMRIRDFFVDGAEKDMQSLLRDGMLEYFKERMAAVGSELEDHLNLKNGLIPLPQWAPRPCQDGLTFIYQQYEVAAYVDGMPEFTLAYEDVAPYLLPEAKRDLGL